MRKIDTRFSELSYSSSLWGTWASFSGWSSASGNFCTSPFCNGFGWEKTHFNCWQALTSMAVRTTTSLVVAGLAGSELGCQNLRNRHHSLTWEKHLKSAHKWGGMFVGRTMRIWGDENPWKPMKVVMHVVDHHPMDGDVSHGVHTDLVALPSGC